MSAAASTPAPRAANPQAHHSKSWPNSPSIINGPCTPTVGVRLSVMRCRTVVETGQNGGDGGWLYGNGGNGGSGDGPAANAMVGWLWGSGGTAARAGGCHWRSAVANWESGRSGGNGGAAGEIAVTGHGGAGGTGQLPQRLVKWREGKTNQDSLCLVVTAITG